MRRIDPAGAFKRDLKREKKGRFRRIIEDELWVISGTLANNIPLALRYHDHPLHGDWEGCRECHVRPDLLLVYRYEGEEWLILERLGSHAEIFGM